MKYLVINTAGSIEIVINNDGNILSWVDHNSRKASEMLLLKIDELLSDAKLSLNDMDFLGCVNGPGSFTGIRIGLNTIKTFGYALNKQLVIVDYLKNLAYNTTNNVVCISDGWSDNCYIAVYDANKNTILEPQAVKIQQAKEIASQYGYECVITSPLEKDFPQAKVNDCTLSLVKAMDDAIIKNNLCDYTKAEAYYILPSQAERDAK